MSRSGRSESAKNAVSLKENGIPRNIEEQSLAQLKQELQETRKSLEASNGKLRMALDVGRLGAWERDIETGSMVSTPAFKAHLGLRPDAALDYEQLKAMYHPDDAERIEQAISYSLRTKTDFQVEHRVIKPDGAIGRILLRGNAIYDEDGNPTRLMGVIQDINERERVKEEISLAQRRQEFLLELNDQIGELTNPFLIMETAIRNLAKFLNVDAAGFGEIQADKRIMIIHREWSKGIVTNEGLVAKLDDYPDFALATLKQGLPFVVQDVKADPRLDFPALQDLYSMTNVRTTVGVPVMRNGLVTGVMYVNAGPNPRTWTTDEVTLIEDIAERTWIAVEKARAEKDASETDARFRMIAESLPALVWIIDLKLELTYTNDRWLSFSGLAPSEALGDSWMRWVHPDDLARVVEDMKTVRENASSYSTEMRYRSAEGVYRWHMVQAAPMRDADGNLQGWIGTSVDIHDLKETEEALRANQQQLRMALEAAKMGDWSWKANSKRIIMSDRAAEIFGLPSGSSIMRDELHDRIHPADRAHVLGTIQKAFEDRKQYHVEYRIIRAGEGAPAWIAAQGQPIYNADGSIKGTTGVFQDITERKHAEERQQLLIRELHHRVKNTLATVQAIVGSTARTATSIDDFYQGFVGRIVSLARTHNLLTEDLWQKADLHELIQTELGPYEDETRNRILIEGPPIELPSEAAVPIGMAIHELTTNAAKHGALSTFGGQVEVRWRIDQGGDRPMLHFAWAENGGPRVTTPARQGFGSRLLQRVLTTQLQAQVSMDFQEKGINFRMVMPVPGSQPLFNPGN
jgi:PAS domain S-box-containing protein